jgi:hypothetical protein
MFDSPIARCEIIEEMVLIDETQQECAREHGCPPGRICPLARYFAEPVGGMGDIALPGREKSAVATRHGCCH